MSDPLTILRLIRIEKRRLAANRTATANEGGKVKSAGDLVFKTRSKAILREEPPGFQRVIAKERNGQIIVKKRKFDPGDKSGNLITGDNIHETFNPGREIIALGNQISYQLESSFADQFNFSLIMDFPGNPDVRRPLKIENNLLIINKDEIFEAGESPEAASNFRVDWEDDMASIDGLVFIDEATETALKNELLVVFNDVRTIMKKAYQDAMFYLQDSISDHLENIEITDDTELGPLEEKEEEGEFDFNRFDKNYLSEWVQKNLGIVDPGALLETQTKAFLRRLKQETGFRREPKGTGDTILRFRGGEVVEVLESFTSGAANGWSRVLFEGEEGFALTMHLEAVNNGS